MKPYGVVLGEGLYWYAEKLTWGYEGVGINHSEALRLFRQAAELGCSDAFIRLGQLHERAGTKRDASAAVVSYRTAVEQGNFYGLAFLAKLVSRTTQNAKANAFWDKFITAMKANPEPGFLSASPGELLHEYIGAQLRLGHEPNHLQTLRKYQTEIIGYHQQLLEHANTDELLDRIEPISNWMMQHLKPHQSG